MIIALYLNSYLSIGKIPLILQHPATGFNKLLSGSLPCDLPTSNDFYHGPAHTVSPWFSGTFRKVYCRLSLELGNTTLASSLLCVMPQLLIPHPHCSLHASHPILVHV